MLWKMVIALVPFNTFPSGQDEKVWNVVKLPRNPTVHLPLQIQKLIHKEIKIGRRCFSLERNGKSNPVEEAGGNSMSWELPEKCTYTFAGFIIGREGTGDTERSKSVYLS